MGELERVRQTRGGRLQATWRSAPSQIALQLLLDGVSECLGYLQGRVLDVGCGQKPFAPLLPPSVTQYIGIDVAANSAADVRASALSLPFSDGAFDGVLCTEVLEHLSDPDGAVREFYRVLKPGGTLLASAPQTYWLHEAPHDYFRFTRFGLEQILRRNRFELKLIQPRGDTLDSVCDLACKLGYLTEYGILRLAGSLFGDRGRRVASVPARAATAVLSTAYLALRGTRRRPSDRSELLSLGHIIVASRTGI
jgi:SAM-dependent methyltransferase